MTGWPLTPHRRGLPVVECHPTWGLVTVWEQWPMFNVQPWVLGHCTHGHSHTYTPAFISLTKSSSSVVTPPLPHNLGTSTWLLLYAERCYICALTHSWHQEAERHTDLRQTFLYCVSRGIVNKFFISHWGCLAACFHSDLTPHSAIHYSPGPRPKMWSNHTPFVIITHTQNYIEDGSAHFSICISKPHHAADWRTKCS